MLKRNLIIAVIFISGLFAIETLAQDATTQTFNNAAAITINDNANAALYPSNITDGDGPNFNAFGTLTTADATFNRPSGCGTLSGTTTRFDAIPFTVSVAGNVTLSFEGADGGSISPNGSAFTGPDTFLILYSGTFNPASPLTGCTAFNDDISGSSNRRSRITGNLVAGSYTAVVTSFNAVPVNTTDDAALPWSYSLAINLPPTITVNSAADPGTGTCDATECTLREALAAAVSGAVIGFSPLFNTPQTINLLTALPNITTSVTIVGPGANLLTVRRDFNAATNFRIFAIPGGLTNGVAISGMTITGGNAGGGGGGGGIASESHLTLTNVHVTGNRAVSGDGGGVFLVVSDGVFTGCTFSGNTAGGSGGGISYQASGNTLRLVNSTVSGNQSSSISGGGGIFTFSNTADTRLEVVNSTIANNIAPSGGGIRMIAFGTGTATTTLRNSIIANNTPNNLATEAGGGVETFQTLGFNLSNDYTGGGFTPLATDITNATPRLAPLALYGGQTPTHALFADSPAIDAGDRSSQTTDARGRPRPFDVPFVNPPSVSDNADIGAVEMQASLLVNANAARPGSLRDADTGAAEMQSRFLVTNANGTPVFLRDAIVQSPPNSDILFGPLFNSPQTIPLGGTQLLIDKNLNIIAPGANLVTVSGGNQSRVFEVSSGVTFTLSGMTITGGNSGGGGSDGGGILNNGTLNVFNSTISANTSGGKGGGIWNSFSGVTTVTNSTISGNTSTSAFAGTGGGIDSTGSLTVTNSTISDNRAPSGTLNGGGIWSTSATATITNSTITNNSAAGAISASGVFKVGGTVNIRNSIIAGNVGNATQPDVVANNGTGITSNGFNLIGNRGTVTFGATGDQFGTGSSPLAPRLAPLALNGGTTPTHALLGGSTALDRGTSSGSTTDQRGLTRPVDLAGINNTSDASDIGAFEAQTVPVGKAPFDYDGDNKTDISIFRPAPSEWWINRSTNGSTFALQFGTTSDKIVPADFTGDGKTDVAFWRPSTGFWFVLRSEDSSFFSFPFGTTGDVPVPADYDGDGKADAAVFRESSLTWFISKSSGGTDIIGFGAAGDKPVVADYDGDSKADIAIYRTNGGVSEWWIRRSSNASVFALQFGTPTDKAVQGDYTGDGKADVAFWRPSTGFWFILRSEDFSFFSFPFGGAGDIPVPGDYDGDGKFDAGVFRPSNQTWFIQRSTAGTLIQQFGIAGDLPTPSAFVP